MNSLLKIRLLGINPQKQPCSPQNGWYAISVQGCPDIQVVLDQFGLSSPGLTILCNGRHVDPAKKVNNGDEIQVFLKSLGG